MSYLQRNKLQIYSRCEEKSTALYCTVTALWKRENRLKQGISAFSTIVGYQEIETPAGSSMRTATFKAISGDYKVSDIKVEGAVGAGNEYGQLINADGTWGATYYYLTEDESFVETGWYKDAAGSEPVTDADVLTIGQAFIFSSDSDIVFTYAGEVIAQPAYSVPAGSSIVGNPSPVTFKLSEITVEGATGAGGEYGYLINADGTWGNAYYYLTEDEVFVETGWYKDASGAEAVSDEDVLAPSESMIFTSENDLTFTFPAVL